MSIRSRFLSGSAASNNLKIKKSQRHVWRKLFLSGLLLASLSLNGIAWMQAYAMTHYTDSDVTKTAKPESLSVLEKAWVVLTGVRVPRPENTRSPESIGLDHETHLIRFDDDSDEYLEAWYTPAAQTSQPSEPQSVGGSTVLLFPPYAASKQALLVAGKIFHELGYNVLWVDFRGAGGSTGYETTMGVREGIDVAQAVRYVEENWNPDSIVLYGASLGSVAVMRAIAHENIAPDAAILESPFDSLLGTVRHRFSASGIPSFPSAELLVLYGSLQQNINGFTHNPSTYSAVIDVPTLVLHGVADTRVLVKDAEAVFAPLPNRKELVFFPTVGHGAFAVDDPARWTRIIQTFLSDGLADEG